MTNEQELVSLALTDAFVEVQGVRMPINPSENYTLSTLLKNKPEFMSTADITEFADDYSRREITLAVRSLTTKVNSRLDVIQFRRRAGTGTRLFAIMPNVVEASFLAAVPNASFSISDPHWRLRAACNFAVANLFNTSENGKSRFYKDVSKMFCDNCVVKDDCLADAVINGDEHGIRGGTLPADRVPLVRAYAANHLS